MKKKSKKAKPSEDRSPRWAGLLLCSSLALFAAPAMTLEVRVEAGLISIDAELVAVQTILEALALESRLRLEQERTVDRLVSVNIRNKPLPDVLDLLLDSSDSYQLVTFVDDERNCSATLHRSTLWVFGQGRGDAALVPSEEAVLLHGSASQRKDAIRSLRDLRSTSAVRSIAVALSDDDKRIRRAAVEALSRIGSEEALAALGSALTSGDWEIKSRAASAIADIGGRSAAAYLDVAMADPDPQMRAVAARALGDLDEDAARYRLQTSLSDPDEAVREIAAELLEDFEDGARFQVRLAPQEPSSH